jgi:hypothetical protein
MQFRTQIPILRVVILLTTIQDGVFRLLLCWKHVAKIWLLQVSKPVQPFGIIFNPVSIDKLVSRVVTNNYFKEEDLFSQWAMALFWTTFWVIELGQSCFLTSINALIDVTKQHFAEASHVILPTEQPGYIVQIKVKK